MRIAQLELSGFRGVRSGCITFPEHGALLGANNVGKTAVTEALAFLFGRERVAFQLSDWDFFSGQPKPDSRFTIMCTITDFSSDDPSQHPDWFAVESAAQPVWWNESESKVTFELDQPTGAQLAAQVALCARYDEEDCEIETKRYFYYGPGDPFTDGCNIVSSKRLQELGVFILPGNRQWDKLLGFGSSSFLKVLRQSDAIPGQYIESLKKELRDPNTKVEAAPNLKPRLAAAERELRSFMMLESSGSLAYRVTSLDTLAVLQTLLPHVDDGILLPLSRQGAGMVSLQSFLIVLAFAEKRKEDGKNFILVAEEPELHLHPSLHRRLVSRIRAVSTQSIITTHSPLVAASYQPMESVFLRNTKGTLTAVKLRSEPVKAIKTNSIRKLYLQKREAFYEAILGAGILVPEGEFDHDWLRLLQQLAESSDDTDGTSLKIAPLSIVPTQDSIAETYAEVARLRPDAVPIVDGDAGGDSHLMALSKLPNPPRLSIRFGTDAAIECLAAWVLEPALLHAGPRLLQLLPDPKERQLRFLQKALIGEKKDRDLREALTWEAIEQPQCGARAAEFFNDVAALKNGDKAENAGWTKQNHNSGMEVWVSGHIHK
jgi:putative ATP-dependent endonuclease of the OLD family